MEIIIYLLILIKVPTLLIVFIVRMLNKQTSRFKSEREEYKRYYRESLELKKESIEREKKILEIHQKILNELKEIKKN